MLEVKYNFESVEDVPTEILVKDLCEAQNEKWKAETIMGVILNELVKRNKEEKK